MVYFKLGFIYFGVKLEQKMESQKTLTSNVWHDGKLEKSIYAIHIKYSSWNDLGHFLS